MVTGLSNINHLSTQMIILVYVIQIRHQEVFFQVEDKMGTKAFMMLRPTGQKTGKMKRDCERRGKLRKSATLQAVSGIERTVCWEASGEDTKVPCGFFSFAEERKAIVLTVTKTWKQPKCPLRDKRIKKMRYMYVCVHTYIHDRIPFSHKNNRALRDNMDVT